MEVVRLVVGSLQTNCYLAYDLASKKTLIIDPGDDAEYIIRKINDLQLKPIYIIATHGHFDHVLAVTELKLCYNIPFLMHQADLAILRRVQSSSHYFTGHQADPSPRPDKFLKEGMKIKFGRSQLEVWHTPGHTPGGVCLYFPGIIFSGDIIFANGVGRTDFSYSSKTDLNKSITRILKLPPQTTVYPGHEGIFRLRMLN